MFNGRTNDQRMNEREQVAIMMIGVGDLTSGGGAQRFFADFFLKYRSANGKFRPFLFTSADDVEKMKAAGLDVDRIPEVVVLPIYNNRLKRFLENRALRRALKKHRIRIIHYYNYTPYDYPVVKYLAELPSSIRPKIVVTIVDCAVAHAYNNPAHELVKNYNDRYGPLFSTKIDGVYTWYRNFRENAEEKKWIPTAKIHAISTRYCNAERFFAEKEKENRVVFASRLDRQKHPEWFVEGISLLREQSPELLSGWKFSLLGNGPMREEIREMIESKGLGDLLELRTDVRDTAPVINRSRCYVSCQDYENFPSLAMNEAMAAGNAILARNVGQTDMFLHEGKNGYFFTGDSPKGFAGALKKFLENPAQHDSFGQYSIRLTKEVHTPGNFIAEIEEFWRELMIG
jgi:glycosyltransferase involved in cell wall biosynthesis